MGCTVAGFSICSRQAALFVGIVMLLVSVGLFHVKQPERQWMMRGLWMVSVLALNLSVGLIYALAGLLLSVIVLSAIMQTKTVQVDRFLPRHFFHVGVCGTSSGRRGSDEYQQTRTTGTMCSTARA